jgi:carbamoyl-phosphate synthase small subunit
MTGVITSDSPASGHAFLLDIPKYDDIDFVRTVTTDKQYTWDEPPLEPGAPGHRIVVTDCGLKYNILRLLRKRGCQVIVLPASTSAGDILELNPSGVLLSPGPGDPRLLDYLVDNVRRLVGRVPIMGICLGHQIVARALGADTFKLKFGHRGGNHPVKDLDTGRVYITAQNHGYAVSSDSLPPGLEVSHINLNDDTVEGLRHRDMPLFTIQYHSEGAPGPQDSEYLFDRFLDMVEEAGGRKAHREGLPIG